jgi:long-subunit acyl-CoA synthetase (AMP-forming)
MKKLLTLRGIASAVAAVVLLAACQTTSTTQSSTAQTEALLAQSGFKVITVTTPKQQQAVAGLPDNKISAVKYNGKLFYVFPTAQDDRVYVGKQKQFDTFKKVALAQQSQQAQAAQAGQSTMNPPPTMTFRGVGPHNIVVDQFDGFGPMGTAQLGDW